MVSLCKLGKGQDVVRVRSGLPVGGGVLSPKSYVDVPAGPRKSDYLYTNFLPNFPPISIPFSKEKHPISIKLGAFYNNLPKIHPIYVIWAPSSLMKTPRSLYQISRKSAPKGRHIYVYHVNVRTPPPGRDSSSLSSSSRSLNLLCVWFCPLFFFKILVWSPDLWFELYFCLIFLLCLAHQLQGQVKKKKKSMNGWNNVSRLL